MNKHILVVDDEVAIRDMVRMALEAEDFQVSDANNAHEASMILDNAKIDLILLDWMMPGVSGINFASRLRQQNEHSNVGIIMLTAKDDEDDLVRGLDVGADDYITKPFSTKTMISRLRAVLRRLGDGNGFTANKVTAGRITIDCDQYIAAIDGKHVRLSPTEFRLLHFLSSNANRVYARDQLLDNVWGEQVYVEDRTVDVHIRRLRKVLEQHHCDDYIETVRGVGYRFSVPNDA